MGEWSKMTLKDAEVVLIDCVHKTPGAVSLGRPYVGIPQMKDGRIEYDTARKISEIDYHEWRKKARPQLHDVVLSRRTNPGVTAIVTEDKTDFALGQNLVLLRSTGSTVYPPFLKWLTRTPEWWGEIERYNNVGAVFDSLKCGDVPNFELSIPDVENQKVIANILSVLDDKIELNRRTNETLEAMAQAIFKDWFVDFGPVRRKMQGETNPNAILGGLIDNLAKAASLAALFPDTLGDNGLPEGWREQPFSYFVEIVGGGTPKTSIEEYWGGRIPWYSVVDTPSGSDVFVFETQKTITQAGEQNSSARLVPPGTTIISARGTVGNLAMAAVEMTFNQSCYGLLPSNGTGPTFVYLATQHVVHRLQQMAHGSVFSTITRQTFDNAHLAAPPHQLFEVFEAIAAPLFAKIKSNVHEKQTLARTRDYLLPKLMSGQIRAGDIQGMRA